MMTDGTKFYKMDDGHSSEKNPHSTRCSLRYRGNRPYTLHSHGYSSREGEGYEIDHEIKYCPQCGCKLIVRRERKAKPKTKAQRIKEATRAAERLEKFREALEKQGPLIGWGKKGKYGGW